MCEFWDDHNQVYLRLRELVIYYLNETEDYDQRVCSARKGKMAMPANGEEMGLISRHAYSCLQRHLETARKERLLDEMSWTRMRQKVEREWEAEYIPLDKRTKVGRVNP